MAQESAAGAIAPSASETVVQSPESAKTDVKADPPDFRKVKHKLKVNEKDHDLDYDTVIKLAQKGMASDEVFRKASAKEKKMGEMFERMRQGDLDFLEEIAGDEKLTKWAEKKLLKIIERNEMSPEQRALLEERAKRERLENDLKSRDERDTEARSLQLREQASVDLDQQISNAFKSASLPMTPSRLERVAQYLDASLNTSRDLMDAGKALTRVVSEIRSDAAELLSGMTAEQLREFLPKQVLDAIRRADIADVRSQDPMRRPTPNGQPRKVSTTKQQRMSTDDFFNHLDKKFGG